jgi:hypothetical protein
VQLANIATLWQTLKLSCRALTVTPTAIRDLIRPFNGDGRISQPSGEMALRECSLVVLHSSEHLIGKSPINIACDQHVIVIVFPLCHRLCTYNRRASKSVPVLGNGHKDQDSVWIR